MSDSLDRAVDFLVSEQLEHGEFPTYRFADTGLAGERVFDSSPFVTSFAVYGLGFVGSARAAAAVERGVEFLIGEREGPGVWRYWSSRNEATIEPDVDATACAAFVVKRFASERHESGVDDVLLSNRTLRGMFKTWLRGADGANDVGSGVNANVALYLGECEGARAAVEHVCRIVNEDREAGSDWYYVDPMALYYLVSRAYFHGVTGFEASMESIVAKVRGRQGADGAMGDELATAMGVCALVNAGESGDDAVARGVECLVASQGVDGGWPARAFYAGPEPPGPHAYWWGSEALTTALCVEALARTAAG